MTSITGRQIRDGTVDDVDLTEAVRNAIFEPLTIVDDHGNNVRINIGDVLHLLAGENISLEYNENQKTIVINSINSGNSVRFRVSFGTITQPDLILTQGMPTLSIRSGLDRERTTIIPRNAELIYCKDTNSLWIGDGTTLGGKPLTNHLKINDTSFSENETWSSAKIKSAIGEHTHNDLYYSKLEIDSRLNNINSPSVKVSNTDTTAEFLTNKIVTRNGITKSIESHNGVEQILIKGSAIPCSVNGSIELCCYDTIREKYLSASTQNYSFTELSVSRLDWLNIGNCLTSRAGYVMPYDATITALTAFIGKDGTTPQDFYLYVNDTPSQPLFVTTGHHQEFLLTNKDKNIDLMMDDKIQIRAGDNTTTLKNVVVEVYLKWRGTANVI